MNRRTIHRFSRKLFRTVSGVSMVELMVALAITGVLGASVYTAFVSQVRSHSTQDQFHRMEQNAKMAVDVIARELRMAGFGMAYVSGGTTVNDMALVVGTATLADGTSTGATIETNNDASRGYSDALVIRRGGTIPFEILFYNGNPEGGEALFVKTTSDFEGEEGDFLYLRHPDGKEFRSVLITKVNENPSDKEFVWAESYPGSFVSDNGDTADYTGGTATVLKTLAFYLDSSTSQLVQKMGGSDPQVLANNVEDFQLAYQTADGTWHLDGVDATVPNPGDIRAVRVSIVVRAEFEDEDNPIYSHVAMEDGVRHPVTGTDGYRRMAFSTTIKIRNMDVEL